MSNGSSHNENGHGHEHGSEKKVKIFVDNHPKHVEPGDYLVSEFKEVVGVPADKELEFDQAGTLTPLADDQHITISGGENFFSHVKRGGSALW